MSEEKNFTDRRAQAALTQNNRKPIYKKILGRPSDPWYGAELVDVDQFARDLLGSFVRNILHPPLNPRVLGFKDIHYHKDPQFFPKQLEIMEKYFSNSRFILQTRNSAEVAQSSWWKTQDRASVIDMLAQADSLFKDVARGRSNCLLWDYDNYLHGPEGVRPLFDFLHEEFNEARIQNILDDRLTH